jgi:lipopolysaccharide/colanic/teichoic acid biosynthesis glycosyltransferase
LEIINLLREYEADELIITLAQPGTAEIMNLAGRCRENGIMVSVVPHPYELYLSKPQLLEIGGLPVLQLRDGLTNFANSATKRVLDLVLGMFLFFLSIPVVITGAVLLLGKRGGPFVREIRCGQYGKLFKMWRLQSDRDAKSLPWYETLLQQLSVTELPQLWNVLRGEMSLVGPRPESPERVKHYSDWQRQRLKVKPGITGLGQVYGLREQHSSEDKARFDLQYMMRASFFLDFSLLLQTIWTLVARAFQFHRLRANGDSSDLQPFPDRIETSGELIEGTMQSAHSTQSSAD